TSPVASPSLSRNRRKTSTGRPPESQAATARIAAAVASHRQNGIIVAPCVEFLSVLHSFPHRPWPTNPTSPASSAS
ncbi:MAG: hypothetical protein ACK56F_23400, partial [bacterium]